MNKANIFVSYCHEDIDRDLRDMILNDLANDGRATIISDRLAQLGDDIDKFMELVSRCHAVIILCTPEFHKRIVNRVGSVYVEYKAIIDSQQKMNEDYAQQSLSFYDEPDPLQALAKDVRDRRFAIMPVLMSGSVEVSIPTEFRHRLWADFVGMISTVWRSTGESRPQKNFRNAYDTFVKSAITTAVGVLEIRNSDADEQSKNIFNQIFFELKHDAQTINSTTIKKLFVKTLEFQRVTKQQSFILVGRKGSGKSTLADYLTYGPTNKWKTPLLYNVDDLPLEYLFLIVSAAKHKSDQLHVLTVSSAMKFAWEALIHYLCFEILATEARKDQLSLVQRDRFHGIRDTFMEMQNETAFANGLSFLTHMPSVEMARRHAYFGYALSRAIQFVSILIMKAPTGEAEFNSYIIKNLTPEHFFVEIFDNSFLSTFYNVIKHCQRNFLIALDGFDSNFQSFRFETFRSYRDTELFDARTRFEQDWLSGLIAAVRRCKRRLGTSPLSGRVDFCVTIPKDRFIEFLTYDRDAYEWERKRIDISWTGVELAILLRKRLEVYTGQSTSKDELALQRLASILNERFKWLPSRIPIALEKRTIDLDFFQYLLRHTFWRPRDILFLAGRVISAAEYYRSRNLEFDSNTLKLIVSRSLTAIINTEFIKEFNGTIENIEYVELNRFAVVR